jgi:hypothetical protein
MAEWVETGSSGAESGGEVGVVRIVPRIVSRKQFEIIQNGK